MIFPLLSSMTADLYCWVLVRALRVLQAFLLFPDIITFSMFLHYSSIHSSFHAFIYFLISLFTFLWLVLLRCQISDNILRQIAYYATLKLDTAGHSKCGLTCYLGGADDKPKK